MSGLEIRQAREEDADELVSTLSEAARWLLDRGIRQWPDPFPRDRVEALVRRGEFFVARLGGEPAGSLVLRWSDVSFWGEQPDDAGYVHALAVRRKFAGQGLGARLLAWAEARVGNAGREFLRLDCMAENAVLRTYYERLGFELQGEALVEDFVAALYERRCRAGAGSGGGQIVTHAARSGHGHARFRRIRSQRERGWTASPTQEGVGVRSLSGERPAVMGACEWREFWRARGMRELLALLGSSWPPLAGASAVVREACAFRIASLLGSRAGREAIAGELARIRRDELGLEPKPPEDGLAAGRVADWFAEASHP